MWSPRGGGASRCGGLAPTSVSKEPIDQPYVEWEGYHQPVLEGEYSKGVSDLSGSLCEHLRTVVLEASFRHRLQLQHSAEEYHNELENLIDESIRLFRDEPVVEKHNSCSSPSIIPKMSPTSPSSCPDVSIPTTNGNFSSPNQSIEAASDAAGMSSRVSQSIRDMVDEVPVPCCPVWERLRLARIRAKIQGGDDKLRHVLLKRTDGFDKFMGLAIVMNAVVMAIILEAQGWQNATFIGLPSDRDSWRTVEEWCTNLEYIFATGFALELMLRLGVRGRSFFKEPFNIFDTLLVLISVIELYVLEPLNTSSVGNVTSLRLLRLARAVRALRLVRTANLFGGLRVLVKALISCGAALMWSICLLLVLMTIAGLMMATFVQGTIQDEATDEEMRRWIWTHYGTSSRAIYTMFEFTLAGCWPNYARPILEKLTFSYAPFFIIYVCCVVFAVSRIISAIFLKETMDAANNDAEIMLTERARKKQQYLKKLGNGFRAVDQSGDGMITEDEFNVILSDPTMKAYMQALELEAHEGHALFRMLDDGDGVITYEEFIEGVSRLKGQARSLDLIATHREVRKLSRHIHQLAAALFPTRQLFEGSRALFDVSRTPTKCR